MKIKMYLESDTIFSEGMSTPGGVDLQVLTDEHGFPYYRATTFKGVFRENLERYLGWLGKEQDQIEKMVDEFFGKGGDTKESSRKLRFNDFTMSPVVKKTILDEGLSYVEVRECTTNMRTFIAIDDNGITQDGSLRTARAVNKGLYFYSELQCSEEDRELIEEVLSAIKWVGTKRNRGFGKVRLEVKND